MKWPGHNVDKDKKKENSKVAQNENEKNTYMGFRMANFEAFH